MQRYAFARRLNDSFVAPFEKGIFMDEFQFDFKFLILLAAGIFLLVQLIYYFFYMLRLSIYKAKQKIAICPAVSVVICARNEFENLQEFLPLVLQQDYPDYEVVVVNDCSWDNSYDFLKALALQYPILRIADIKEVQGREHGKKFALTIGIKAAKNDVLVLTDADCYPSSNQWLKHMLSSYNAETEIVLGHGRFRREKGLLNYIIRWESFFNAALYFSRTLWGKPYMAVGRNLSYKQALFFAQKGFAAHMHIVSGDDDLFVQSVAKGQNTQICIHKEAHTLSIAKRSWKEWFRQKKRHNSTSRYYKAADKLYLWMYPLTCLLFYLSCGILLFFQYQMLIIISAIFLRALIQIFILHAIGKKLSETSVSWLAPVNELLMYIFVYPLYKLSTFRIRKNKWK